MLLTSVVCAGALVRIRGFTGDTVPILSLRWWQGAPDLESTDERVVLERDLHRVRRDVRRDRGELFGDLLNTDPPLSYHLPHLLLPLLFGLLLLDPAQALPKRLICAGRAVFLTDLADEARVSVYFKSSPPPHGAFNHQHADQNAFVVNAGGRRLAIESGYYDGYKSPHWYGWLKQTRAKNAITYDGGRGQMFFEDTAVRRMGYGRITRFEHQPGYDLVTGDATHAYGGALEQALRTLVYLRPGVLVVHDRLASKIPRRWEWNIHALERMRETGERSIRIENGGQTLCVRLLGTPAAFEQTDQWTERPRRGEPQWHGRFATAPLPAAEFVALLEVGCGGGVEAARDAGGWTVRAAGRTLRLPER